MIIKINDYDGKYRTVSFAASEKTRDELLSRELDVITVADKTAVFYPENICFKLSDEAAELFGKSCDYDAFEISISGCAYKFYDSRSLDNAILVTNKCNSNCIMCPTAEAIRRNNEIYSGAQLIRLARNIPDDAAHITITGGEPFIIKKDMFELLGFLKDKLPDISYLLLTNGRAFCSREYTELFKQTVPPDLELGIPLHGFNAKTHDGIVRSDGAFRQTYLGLKHLLSVNARVELRIVVSRLNESFITEIAQLIADEFSEVKSVKFIGLEMTGNAAVNREKVWIDYPTAFQRSKDGINLLTSSGIDVGIYNFPLCAVENKYWNICEKSISPFKIRYVKECDSCTVKDACGGVFSGTLRLAKEKMVPIR